MLIKVEQWQRIRHRFSEEEKGQLNGAVTGQTICPRGYSLDPTVLEPKLKEKLNKALDALREGPRRA